MAQGYLDGVLIDLPDAVFQALPSAASAPSKWRVDRQVVVQRLIDAGKAAQVQTALTAKPDLALAFSAMQTVPSDHTALRALITALGLSPDTILAPV